ncbi:MAG: ABC transporter permease subunit [Nannocystaceae bacterium]|nr:ABC transporter permease subunit [Nannocystaceae bacterium]
MHGLRAIVCFFAFEIRMRVRQPSMWLFFAVFGLLGFGAMASDAVQIGGASGQAAINSPFVIAQMLSIMSVLGVLLVTAFAAGAVVRDFDTDAYQLFYTKPVRAVDYLLGRFAGGTFAAIVSIGGTAVGMAIGTWMPWVDSERLVSFSFAPYLHTMVVFVAPNLIVMGAIFFTLATLTRRMLWAYVGVAAFFVLYVLSQAYVGDLDNDTFAALADPFGLGAMQLETRYWTAAERNESLVSLTGVIGLNRVVWLAIGAAALGVCVMRFRLIAPAASGSKATAPSDAKAQLNMAIPPTTRRFGPSAQIQQFMVAARVELRGVITSNAYRVLAVFSVVNVYGGVYGTTNALFGTPVYPVTALMVNVVNNSMSLFMLIVITFQAGELLWKERRVGLAEVSDATPTPNWVLLLAKLTALWGAVIVLLGVGLATAVTLQLLDGYTDLEFGLYAKGLFGVHLLDWALLCVLAVFFQVAANHKYLGFGLMVAFFVVSAVLPSLDFEHLLYRPNSVPSGPYSDMNGYGHFVTPMVWLRVYWACFAVALIAIGNLWWPRGTDTRFRLRLTEARRRVTRFNTLLLAVTLLGFAASGAWIYFNTNVLNDYRPGDSGEDDQQRYEESYKRYEDLPQPQIIASDLDVDIFPETRQLDIAGHFTLENRTDTTIERLHVRIDNKAHVTALSLDDTAKLEVNDEKLGYRIYQLTPAMAPGDQMTVDFDFTFREDGFPNSGSNREIVQNGTFFHNDRYVPHFGYDRDLEISAPNDRRERNLPERVRMAAVDDAHGRMTTYISREATWIDFSATVSTSVGQTALAPGYLIRDWVEGDRHYFRYEMDAPILNFYGFLSGRYTVARDRWRDVEIAVYHHAPHDRNVARMIDAVKKSLDYFTTNFSPYQHRQLRIVEFPRYAGYAQSLPNIVPYSESIGFIADLRDPDDIDSVFYITAHEVAHQWWAHQVIGGNVQGSTLMSETLAQYSALMVMEKEYGRAAMRKFMRHELDRYLLGRSGELHRELPLMLVENQPYVHYNKGSLVMYTLREYLGEEAVNRALAQYIRDVGFQSPPYTNSVEFVEALRAVTPAKFEYLIEDLFETITLYDNRVTDAKAHQLADGRWEVELTVTLVKFRADEDGAESATEIDDWIQVGALDADELPIGVQFTHVDGETSSITFTLDDKPLRAGIDPRAVLVDRNPDDNMVRVDIAN